MPQQQQGSNPKGNFYKYTNIATKMIVVILVCTFGGRWIDSKINIDFPVFTLVLVLFGVGLSMYIVIKDLIK